MSGTEVAGGTNLRISIWRMMVAIACLGVSFACAAAILRIVQASGDYAYPAVFGLSIGTTISFFTGLAHFFGRAKDGALVGLWTWIYGFRALLLWELGRVAR